MAKELSTVFIFFSIGIRVGFGRQPHTEKKPNNELRVLNGTMLTLDCAPAEYLVRTHMAPDFENPQLVRRLDWLHDEALVASYQQDVITDASRQWWVAGTRYELIKPFYQLRISPLLPEDSGRYKCRLETDPLFALDSSTSTTSILVLVRPPSPSKPHVTANTDRTVTLSWSQQAGPAHRPINRYAILVSQLDEENIRVLTTESNQTTITAEGLQPYTRYAFSVRAENVAGQSNFGQEQIFRTMGEAPRFAPELLSILNGTAGCVDVEWKQPASSAGREMVGYRIMVHRVGTTAMREWYVRGTKQSLCSLPFYADFVLNIEADNAPSGPPEDIVLKPLSSTSIAVSWREPSVPNGVVTSYQIYYRELKSAKPYAVIRLVLQRHL
ncbi:Protein PTP-4 a [Aphelenchoides avenae]|nr:Protein PTP-4 a [Aphelenchus avenae]